MQSVGTPAVWIGFGVLVLTVLALDLGVFHRHAKVVSMREALIWTCTWIGLSLAFNVGVYYWYGAQSALEFLAGYLIEQALSVDNIFVFLVIFSYFNVPANLQHRVLFWGILGAIVMRAIFIVLGASLMQRFHAIVYVFGLFLVVTGIRLLWKHEAQMHPERNPVVRLFSKFVRTVPDYRGKRFIVHEGGRWYATPLLTVVVVVEATDVVFAIDSIPAVFAVTNDPFIVYTSNIFAILGLRSLYFALHGMMGKFHYLKYGLGLVLAFVGMKMLLSDIYEIPIVVSLLVIISLLGGSVLLSILRPERAPPLPKPEGNGE